MASIDSLTVFAVRHSRAGERLVGELSRLEGEVEAALRPAVRGLVILSTCNRFEVYVDGEVDSARAALAEVLPGSVWRMVEVMRGFNAARHLMEVAAGLDSAILGEHEILGQVRRAWLQYKSRGLTTWLLDQVFHRAMVAGRRVRSETGISRGRVGYPEVAVDVAAERLGGLDGAVVAVVGAGEAGRGIVLSLCDRFKPSKLIVYNRSVEKARQAADACGGEARPLSDLESMPIVDVLFVAVTGFKVPGSVASRARLVVDISNPPAVDPSANVIGFEEVTRVARARIEERRKWVPAARRIIEEELGVLAMLLERSRGDAAASIIMRYAYSLVDDEVRATIRNLERGVDPEEALRVALQSYARKVLHPLLSALRKASTDGRGELVELVSSEYARRLVRLEEARV